MSVSLILIIFHNKLYIVCFKWKQVRFIVISLEYMFKYQRLPAKKRNNILYVDNYYYYRSFKTSLGVFRIRIRKHE